MKKILILFSFLLLTFKLSAPDIRSLPVFEATAVEPFDRLIHAIGMVEVRGDTAAYNEIEQATGFFQIRPIRLDDYNRRTGNNYTLSEMFDYDIAKKVFLYYASQIGPYNYEKIAKNWNGSGHKTILYWNRVKKYL
jgi:hypothetical protein